MQECGGELCAGAAQRMAERDGPAVDIDDILVQVQFADDGERLRRKGLVQFDQADISLGETRLPERFRHGFGRTDAHDFRRDAGHGITRKPRYGFHLQFPYRPPAHHHRCGSAVRDLRGIPRGDGAARAKDRPQPGKGVRAGIGARPFVGPERRLGGCRPSVVVHRVHHVEGHDLVVEAAFRGGGECALVGTQGEEVLFLTGDVLAFRQVFSGVSHVNVEVGVFPGDVRVRHEIVSAHGHQAHGLGAAGHDHVGLSRGDRLVRHRDGLQPGCAKTVDGYAGNRIWQARLLCDDATENHALLRFRKRAAHDHVVDTFGLKALHAADGAVDGGRAHGFGPHVAQDPSPGFAHGRANAADDVCFLAHGGQHLSRPVT